MFHLGTAWWVIIDHATVVYPFIVLGLRLTERRCPGRARCRGRSTAGARSR